MRWHTPLMVLLALQYTSLFATGLQAALNSPPEDYMEGGEFVEEENEVEPSEAERAEKAKMDEGMKFLARVLVLPWPDDFLPLLYVEKPAEPESEQFSDKADLTQRTSPVKRMRYYRKYPWKRQNSRYDPTNPYICNPSKDEVYRLLVALHEARQGNRDRVVDFCNRKRPAFSVYTNIRFLGK